MLIRACGHYVNNPNHIDKLISIKGLPDEWIFRKVNKVIANEVITGVELMPPWEPDVEANIPESIRHLCEPVEVLKIFPPIEKGRESVVDRTTIIGIRFSFMSQPGQELWEKIERYLDRMTPRDQKVPIPVLVAPNHTSSFSPHGMKRTARGTLELFPTEIPNVDLRIIPTATVQPTAMVQPIIVTTTAVPVPPVVVTQAKPTPADVPASQIFPCLQCDNRQFTKQKALKMHMMVKHKIKEPVGV